MIVFNVQSKQKYSIMPLNSKIQSIHAFMKSRPYNAIVKVWIKAIVAALFKEKGHLQTKAYLTTYLCACQKSVSSSTISWELSALTRITCIAKMTIYVHYMSENWNISYIFFGSHILSNYCLTYFLSDSRKYFYYAKCASKHSLIKCNW